MRQFPWKEFGYAVGFIALLLALYVGAYYAMVEPRAMITEQFDWEMAPAYRWGSYLSYNNIFVPMSSIDRKLRPNAWVLRLALVPPPVIATP